MENIQSMQLCQTFNNLNKDVPYFLFGNLCSFFLILSDFFCKITFGSIFHDYTAWDVEYQRDFVDSSKKASL